MTTPETTEPQVQPSVIEQALVKANLTEAVINELKTFKALTINGLDDKAGLEKVHAARIRCKNTRVLAVKICKKGREDAIAEQRRWITKQDEIVAQIEDVENHLFDEENKITIEQERIKREKEQARQAKIQGRVKTLLDMGMFFNGTSYSLAGNEMDSAVLASCTDEEFDSFAATVKAHADDLKAEAELGNRRYSELLNHDYRGTVTPTELGKMAGEIFDDLLMTTINEATARREKEERLKRQEEEQEAERKRLEDDRRKFQEEQDHQQAELRAQQEKIDNEKKSFLKTRTDSRHKQLFALGIIFNGDSFIFDEGGIYVNFHHTDVLCFEDEQWNKEFTKAHGAITAFQKAEEERRQQELKDAEEKAAERARTEEHERLKKAEEDRLEQERIAKEQEQERINALSDKDKMFVLLHKIQDFIDDTEKDCPEFKTKRAESIKSKAFGILNSASTLIRENYS